MNIKQPPTGRSSRYFSNVFELQDSPAFLCDSLLAELLRKEHAEVLPGFYSDKRCWNSVDLGGSLTDDQLRQMCDDSYHLVFEKLTKKAQKDILESEE